jgi:trehalose 6-phosphate phosphatase
MPRHASRFWPEICSRVNSARLLTIFLDFDGTLVPFRRRPADVHVPDQVRQTLQRLARHRKVFIAIVSGRRIRDLQSMLALDGLHIFGLHGAEEQGKIPVLPKKTRLALARAKREARAQLGVLPGIWLEDKVCSLAIHFRGASRAIICEANGSLLRFLAPFRHALFVIEGEKVWEILPREFAGKGATVAALLAAMPRRTLAIYIGDDSSDESAFAALPDQITIRVGRRRASRAQFALRNPAEVIRFLARLEKELS